MIFIVDPYSFPSTSDEIVLSGRIFPGGGNLRAFIDRGPRAVMLSRPFSFALLKEVDYIFIGYNEFVENKEKIQNLRDVGVKVIINLPIVTANLRLFYSPLLFSRVSGLPLSSVVLSSIDSENYFVKFWETEWIDIIRDFSEMISHLNPDGVLFRGLDFYRDIVSIQPSARDDVLDLFKDLLSFFSGINHFVETKDLIEDHAFVNVRGFVVPGLFFEEGMRTDLDDRFLLEEKLGSSNKIIFVDDNVTSPAYWKEFVARSRRRSFIPVLNGSNETSVIDEELVIPHSSQSVASSVSSWHIPLIGLPVGSTRVKFFKRETLQNTAIVEFSPLRWPEILDSPSFFHVVVDEPCTVSFGLDSVQSVLNEDALMSRFLSLGLASIDASPAHSSLHVFMFKNPSNAFRQWLHVPVLQKIVDRASFPLLLRNDSSGVLVSDGDRSMVLSPVEADVRNMIVVQVNSCRSTIVLAFGDEYCVKALRFIFDNISSYARVLNDEAAVLVKVTSVLGSVDEYVPNLSNVSVVPLIEELS